MNKTITITSAPQAQGRPRFTVRGGHAIAFNPHKDTKNWYRLQISGQIEAVITSPIELEMTFYMPIPKSTSKKKSKEMLENKIKHIKKPDIDNLQALILNCFTGIVYRDDSQVYKIIAFKKYSAIPRTEIKIFWQEENEEDA